MYKAQIALTGEEIIILDPVWSGESIESLRQQGREGKLICHVCKQPVLVRAGEKRRWHFAHKDLTNCPLKNESPLVLQAKVLLYNWLKSKLGPKVTIEKHFPGTDLLRPIDCYAELLNGQKIGYWILEKGIRNRWAIQCALSSLGISTVWVPLVSILREDDIEQNSAHLTPTERDIAFSSNYSQLYSDFDKSLSYLDVERKEVLTIRGLRCIHSPQKYKFAFKLATDLDQMLFHPQTGELVHPCEHEGLQELRREIEEQERIRAIKELESQEQERAHQKKLAERQKDVLSRPFNQKRQGKRYDPKPSAAYTKVRKEENVSSMHSAAYNHLNETYPCQVCGEMTVNWTFLDLGSKTCICSRECLKRSRERIERNEN